MIAARDVLSQPRDGYTLLLCTHFEPINTAVYKNAQFKLSDLAPVSLIAKYYYGLALANAVPADDFEAFVQYAKAHPGEISYATIGAGSAQEILARQLEKLTGITMNRIPFRGGAQVVQELVAGRVQFYVSPTMAIVPQYDAKQLKILAVSAPERLRNLAAIPTLTERGVDFMRFGWLGVCAGAGTPQPILDLLQRQIATIVGSADYRAMIDRNSTRLNSSHLGHPRGRPVPPRRSSDLQLQIRAVSAPERLRTLAAIPTLTERGVDFMRFGWLGVCAGAGTPQPILDLLQRQIATIVGSADYRAMIEKAGSIAVSSTADEHQQATAQTLDDVASSIREFNLQQEQ